MTKNTTVHPLKFEVAPAHAVMIWHVVRVDTTVAPIGLSGWATFSVHHPPPIPLTHYLRAIDAGSTYIPNPMTNKSGLIVDSMQPSVSGPVLSDVVVIVWLVYQEG